ncbi:MAG: PilW family protein, partial [Pseudonocardiaceae bacterium]
MRKNQGFTLAELLVAMVIFAVVLGGAMKFVTAQSRAFNRGVDDISVLQNLSFGADNLDSQLRTTGGNAPDAQPPVVYANANTFAFNADYAANDLNDISAVYIDVDAPPAEVEAIRQAQQFIIPGSVPAFTYPSTDYSVGGGINSPAETIILFFTPDLETPRADDFVLLRQVNNNPPEVLVRKVLPDSTNLPFFRYYKQHVRGGINTLPTLSLVPAAELPMRHNVATHGSPADAASPVDSLRAVLVSYQVTNGYTDSRER